MREPIIGSIPSVTTLSYPIAALSYLDEESLCKCSNQCCKAFIQKANHWLGFVYSGIESFTGVIIIRYWSHMVHHCR